jgi:hypothetical protein
VASESEQALEGLRARLDEEEAAYAEVIAAVDRLAGFSLPGEAAPEVHERLTALNGLWSAPARPAGGGLGGALRRRSWDALAPALERQAAFNAALVQLLNSYLGQTEVLHRGLRELASALVRYVQRVQPLVDANARVATALASSRSELILETFDRRLESLARRVERLASLRHRPAVPGGTDEGRLGTLAELLPTSAPIVHVGRGGPWPSLLREKGMEAEEAEGYPLDDLRRRSTGSLGGVLVPREAEPLLPAALAALLAEAHRVLGPGGWLLLEDASSTLGGGAAGTGAVEPDSLRSMATTAGFTDVRVEARPPARAEDRLRPVSGEGLPANLAATLNENVARLNALLFGPVGYALLARR